MYRSAGGSDILGDSVELLVSKGYLTHGLGDTTTILVVPTHHRFSSMTLAFLMAALGLPIPMPLRLVLAIFAHPNDASSRFTLREVDDSMRRAHSVFASQERLCNAETMIFSPRGSPVVSHFLSTLILLIFYLTSPLLCHPSLHGVGGKDTLGISATSGYVKLPVNAATAGEITATETITKVTAGKGHVLIQTREGRVYSMGLNRYGVLGLGSDVAYFELVPEARKIKQLQGKVIRDIAAGPQSSFFIDENGKAYSSGYGYEGQLCTNKKMVQNLPESLSLINWSDMAPFRQISAGKSHTILLDENDRAYACGDNRLGALGITGYVSTSYFTQPYVVDYRKKIEQVSAGDDFTLFLEKDTGNVYGAGMNSVGALGLSTVGTYYTDLNLITSLPGSVRLISAGKHYSHFVMNSSGIVYGSGENSQGQLGDGSFMDRSSPVVVGGALTGKNITVISSGEAHTLFLDSNQQVYATGSAANGKLATNSVVSSLSSPASIPVDGYLVGEPIISVAASDSSSLFLQTWKCFGVLNTNSSTVCTQGHGKCIGANQCSCNSGWFGEQCEKKVLQCFEYFNNDTRACSSHGNCETANHCTCSEDWTGEECQYPKCFGISGSNSTVCSGHGNCTTVDTCKCGYGWQGQQCSEIQTCYGKHYYSDAVCSGHGRCESTDRCACHSSYVGQKCAHFYCFGVLDSITTVCGGKGTCVAPSECVCDSDALATNSSVTPCTSCPAGYACTNGTKQICAAGTKAAYGSGVCTPCQDGYDSSDGASECTKNTSKDQSEGSGTNNSQQQGNQAVAGGAAGGAVLVVIVLCLCCSLVCCCFLCLKRKQGKKSSIQEWKQNDASPRSNHSEHEVHQNAPAVPSNSLSYDYGVDVELEPMEVQQQSQDTKSANPYYSSQPAHSHSPAPPPYSQASSQNNPYYSQNPYYNHHQHNASDANRSNVHYSNPYGSNSAGAPPQQYPYNNQANAPAASSNPYTSQESASSSIGNQNQVDNGETFVPCNDPTFE